MSEDSKTTPMEDLPPTRPHRKLPAELNQQIYLCFNPAAQRKFIYGLGWNFYAMFRHRLLAKTKRVCNPHGNGWNRTNTRATVGEDGLHVCNEIVGRPIVFAEQPFPTSGPHCRVDEFPGTICNYYEVKVHIPMSDFGLSDGVNRDDEDNSWLGDYSNSYAIQTGYLYACWLAGESHNLFPEGAIRPRWKSNGSNVMGCGIVLNPEDKSWIFFTFNGQLLGRKILISPTVDRLYPTIRLYYNTAVEANFGDNPAIPFEYDIHACPGLGLTCI